jgi:hypothetical protein
MVKFLLELSKTMNNKIEWVSLPNGHEFFIWANKLPKKITENNLKEIHKEIRERFPYLKNSCSCPIAPYSLRNGFYYLQD